MSLVRSLQLISCIVLVSSAKIRSKNSKSVATTLKPPCPYPEAVNASQQNRDDIVDLHRQAADVWFNGHPNNQQLQKPCKIRCINGEWVGPICQTIEGDNTYHPVYKPCSTSVFQSNFLVSYKNKNILEATNFDHKEHVQVRCRQFGYYKLIGDSRVNCHNGHWKPRTPTCIPTSYLNNFTDDSSPPTIQVKVTSGSVSIEPSGELAVYPGSVIHLECLHSRSQGEPEWSWTSTYRTYPTGWSIAPGERDWKYRLSIYYVKPQDTGIYTCATPKGLTHSAVVNVLPVTCNAARVTSTDPHLLIHVEGSRLGQNILFSCSDGFKLTGAKNATCQASGMWSADAPRCLPKSCPPIQVTAESTVKLIEQETKYGGRAMFECPTGYQMLGFATLVCGKDETWSGEIPECKEIICSPPLIPQNGKLEMSNESMVSPYGAGAIVTFSCKGVYQLEGEGSIICTDTGFWSNPPPFCRTKCAPLQKVAHGEFVPKKEVFDVGERLSLVCEEGYIPSTRAKPRCLRTGDWTEHDIHCRYSRLRGISLVPPETQHHNTDNITQSPLEIDQV